MFGKYLARELIRFCRRLWPFAIGFAVTGGLGALIVLLDRNSIESTGTIMGIFVFSLSAFILLSGIWAFAIVTFAIDIAHEQKENTQPLSLFIAVKITTFTIFFIIALILIFTGISAFAWKSLYALFSSFKDNWYYFLDFAVFAVIVIATIYIVPISCVVGIRCRRHKKAVLSLGIINLVIVFASIVPEVLLLIHSDSTDMIGVWGTTIFLLAEIVVIDIVISLLAYHALKPVFYGRRSIADN